MFLQKNMTPFQLYKKNKLRVDLVEQILLSLIEKYLAKSNSGLLGVLCGPLSISFDTKYVEQIRDFLGRCQEDKKGRPRVAEPTGMVGICHNFIFSFCLFCHVRHSTAMYSECIFSDFFDNSHHLGISYYVNFLVGLGSNELQLK